MKYRAKYGNFILMMVSFAALGALWFYEVAVKDRQPGIPAMVSAVVASMSAFYHDTMDIYNPRHREIFAHRIIAKLPTIAAAAHKHSLGQPFVYPRNDLDYCTNMLHMFFEKSGTSRLGFEPNKKTERDHGVTWRYQR